METKDSTKSKKRKSSEISGGENDNSVEAENERLKKELAVKDATILKLATKNTELETSLEEGYNGTNTDMEESLKEVEAELNEAQTKMENERMIYENEIHELKLIIHGHEVKINELKDQLSNAKDIKLHLGANKDNAEIQLENKTKKFEAKMNEMNKCINDFQQRNAAWKLEAEEARQKIAARDKEIIEFKKQLAAVRNVKHELEAKKDNAGVQLKNERTKYEAKINEMKSQLNDLKQKNATWKIKVEEARQIIDVRDKEIIEVKKQLSDLITKNDDFVAQLDNQRTEYEAKINEMNKCIVHLKQKDAAWITVSEVARENIATRDQEIRELQNQLTAAVAANTELINNNNINVHSTTTVNEQNAQNPAAKNEQEILELKTALQKSEEAAMKASTDMKREIQKIKDSSGFIPLMVENIFDVKTKALLYNRLGDRTILNLGKIEAANATSWNVYSTETSVGIQMDLVKIFEHTQFNLCLLGKLVCDIPSNKYKLQEILPRIYSCTLTSLKLVNQDLDEYEFLKLISSKTIESLELKQVNIKRSETENLGIDDILNEVSNIQYFDFYLNNSSSIETLAILPRLEKLKHFVFRNCSTDFPLQIFGEFVKKHDNVSFHLHYSKTSVSHCVVQADIKEKAENIVADSTCRLQIVFD